MEKSYFNGKSIIKETIKNRDINFKKRLNKKIVFKELLFNHKNDIIYGVVKYKNLKITIDRMGIGIKTIDTQKNIKFFPLEKIKDNLNLISDLYLKIIDSDFYVIKYEYE